MMTGTWIKTTCAMALMAAVLTGCGKKGPLERPVLTSTPSTTEDAAAPAPQRRFILDGLLD